MRILAVHNRYSSRVPSGENLAVDDELRWLTDAGVEVVRHEVTNDALVAPGPLGRVRDGVEAMWSLSAGRRFAAALERHRPDVVHVHNLFPLLTGSVPAVARRHGVPVVWTVHNRRVRCVGGGNFREGRPCHDCRPGWRLPGVVRGCYAESMTASALVTTASSLFRTTASRSGLTALAISHDMSHWVMSATGLPASRVRVKYNGVAAPTLPVPPAGGRRTFVFLSRLAAYKGVGHLLDAWRRTEVDAELRIVGDGDLAPQVAAAAAADPRIRWVGQVPPDEIGRHLADARAVVVPSIWREPFGRVAAEALAHGRPVITTGQGGLSEIVDSTCGWVTGLDVAAMADALRAAATDDTEVDRRGRAGRARWRQRFSPEATTRSLVAAYAEVTGGADPATGQDGDGDGDDHCTGGL